MIVLGGTQYNLLQVIRVRLLLSSFGISFVAIKLMHRTTIGTISCSQQTMVIITQYMNVRERIIPNKLYMIEYKYVLSLYSTWYQ